MAELDHGFRCEAHVGEVFPPRCGACGNLGATEPAGGVQILHPLPRPVRAVASPCGHPLISGLTCDRYCRANYQWRLELEGIRS